MTSYSLNQNILATYEENLYNLATNEENLDKLATNEENLDKLATENTIKKNDDANIKAINAALEMLSKKEAKSKQ